MVRIRTIEKENNPVSTPKGKKFPEHFGTIKRQIFPEYKTNYSENRVFNAFLTMNH